MDIGATLIAVAAGAILISTLIATVSRLHMQRIRVSLETVNRPPRVATYTLLVCLAALPLLLTACGKGGGGY